MGQNKHSKISNKIITELHFSGKNNKQTNQPMGEFVKDLCAIK